MKRYGIAAALMVLLTLSCVERTAKPSAKSDTPAARTQNTTSQNQPVNAAALGQGATAGHEAKQEAKPAPAAQAEAPFVPPQSYAVFVDGLLPAIAASDAAERERGQRELDRAVAHAGAPGNESRRAELCQAIVARLGPDTPEAARLYLLRQMERVGSDACVPALSGLLSGKDASVREGARRALQNIPGAKAREALLEALRKTDDPGWRAVLINAVAARRDPTTVGTLAAYMRAEQPEVALAAIAGVAEVGGVAEVANLKEVLEGSKGERKAAAADALVRIADRLTAGGEGRSVMPALWKLTGDASLTANVRGAALRILVIIDPKQAKPHVLRALGDHGSPELQAIAARLLGQIPDEDVIFTIVMTMTTLPADVQCVLIDVLAERGGKGKLPVMAALDSREQSVRVAALRALQKLGDIGDIAQLARVAALNEGEVRDAARKALERLPGFNVDPALLVELDKQQEPGIRAELVRAVAARGFKLGAPRVAALANEPSPLVRAAAYEALGKLAGAEAMTQLIGFLTAEKDEDAVAAADDAIVSVAQAEEDRDRRAAPILAALKQANGNAAARLLHVLGRLQGPAALTAVRAAVTSGDAAVEDAAFRALADWGDVAALQDLLQLAASENEVRHALAVRGYVRLVRLPSDRSAEETLELVKRAKSLARGVDEQKLVIAALGDISHPAALEEIQAYLSADGLRDEAATGMVGVARRIAPRHADMAKVALEKVIAAAVAEGPTGEARNALKAIEEHVGTIGVWVVSGPYSAEGKGFADVFEQEFDPESDSSGKGGVVWKPLMASRTRDPWIFDLAKLDKCSNCCVYARTSIWSDKEQAARLELGSDDGVKAWLNGRLVHSNPASRAVTASEDKVEVKLQRGWNVLLLKVVQSGGDWGFVCSVRDLAGETIPTLKFDADR